MHKKIENKEKILFNIDTIDKSGMLKIQRRLNDTVLKRRKEMNYKGYHREEYLEGMQKIIGLRSQIETYMDKIFEEGVENIVLCGIGGTISIMLPIEKFMKKRTAMPVYVENAAELVLGNNKAIGEKSLVVLYSASGTTKETVAAVRYCNEQHIPNIGVSYKMDTPLYDELQYPLLGTGEDEYSCDGDYMNLFLIAATFLKENGDMPDYEQFIEALSQLPEAMANTKEEADEEMKKLAFAIKDENYSLLVGGGNVWGPTYCYAMCYMEEMQWMRTKSIQAPEFFHGTLELLEEDTNIMIFNGEDEARPLTDRVINFANRISKKVRVIDTKNYAKGQVAATYRGDFSPAILEAVLGRLTAHLEDATGHSLDIRRYYRVMEY